MLQDSTRSSIGGSGSTENGLVESASRVTLAVPRPSASALAATTVSDVVDIVVQESFVQTAGGGDSVPVRDDLAYCGDGAARLHRQHRRGAAPGVVEVEAQGCFEFCCDLQQLGLGPEASDELDRHGHGVHETDG